MASGLDTVRIRTLSLAFDDDALETAYRSDHARKSTRPLRLLFSLLIAFAVIGAPLLYLDPAGSLEPWRRHLDDFWPRAAVSGALFLTLVVTGLSLTFVRRARNHQQLWCALYMLLFTPLPLFPAEVMPVDLQRHLYPMMIVHLINIHLIIRLRFVNATFVALVVTAFYVSYAGVRLGLDAAELRAQMLNLLLANGFGALGSYQIELYGRREFIKSLQLDKEREKSESLVLNMLPPPIAERLKAGERTIADRVDDATILFADIVGFTALSEDHPPDDIVIMLNELFVAYDALTEKHQLEKIKTIGDAYMVAGGLFAHKQDHAAAVADMAIDMLAHTQRVRETGDMPLHIRIGINSGPVVAGVIGSKKYVYDVWGDTVNIAARMESHGTDDAIHISAATRERLGDAYECEPRGSVDVKGKGAMETYLLRGK